MKLHKIVQNNPLWGRGRGEGIERPFFFMRRLQKFIELVPVLHSLRQKGLMLPAFLLKVKSLKKSLSPGTGNIEQTPEKRKLYQNAPSKFALFL